MQNVIMDLKKTSIKTLIFILALVIETGIFCSLLALIIPKIHNTKTPRFTRLKIPARVGTITASIDKATAITIPKIEIANPCFK